MWKEVAWADGVIIKSCESLVRRVGGPIYSTGYRALRGAPLHSRAGGFAR
jgi:hypothetical protein